MRRGQFIGIMTWGLLNAAGWVKYRLAHQQPKKYEPSHTHLLELQVKQKDAQMANMAAGQAYAAFMAEADKVKREEGWPANLAFDPNTLTYSEPPGQEKK